MFAPGQLVTLFTGVDAHIDHTATFGAGTRSELVTHITGLLTEDRAQGFSSGGWSDSPV